MTERKKTAAEEDRSGKDPHLDMALANPYRTPFRGRNAILPLDVIKPFLPEVNAMVDDYVAATSHPNDVVERLAEPMRRCLLATFEKKVVPPTDLDQLLTLADEGVRDPLLFLTLFRTGDRKGKRKLDWILQAQKSRSDRAVGPAAAALISADLVYFKSSLSEPDSADATQSFIKDQGSLWQHYNDYDQHFEPQDLFIDYLYDGISKLSVQDRMALLIELDSREEPAVSPWVMYFVASRVMGYMQSKFRGVDFISRTAASDLSQFRKYADKESLLLQKAWTLAPRIPLIPKQLMEVEMRAGNTARSFDSWFRHCLSARYSDGSHFWTYQESLATKWGGSRATQSWFAEKCMESRDLESGIPFRYWRSLSHQCWETGFCERLGDNTKFVRSAKTLVELLQDYSQSEPHPKVNHSVSLYTAGTLWQAGELTDLAWFLSVYGQKFKAQDLHLFHVNCDDVFLLSERHSESKEPCWMGIYTTLYSDDANRLDLDKAETYVQQALESLADVDSAVRMVLVRCKGRIRLLRKLQRFEKVILSDADISEWMRIGEERDWSHEITDPDFKLTAKETQIEEAKSWNNVGSLDFSFDRRTADALLTCPFLINPPFRFSMDVMSLKSDRDPYGVSLLVGAHGAATQFSDYNGRILTVDFSHTFLCDRLPLPEWKTGKFFWKTVDAKDQHNLQIDAFADGCRVYADGKLLKTYEEPLKTGARIHLGRYCKAGFIMPAGLQTYRVSNVQIQKLKKASVLDVLEEKSSPKSEAAEATHVESDAADK